MVKACGQMPRRSRDQALLDRFGEHVSKVRATVGYTQQKVADRMGVRPEAVSQIESGKTSPTLSTLVALARALGMPPTALLDFEKVAHVDPAGSEESELLADFRALGEEERALVRGVTRGLRR